MEVSAVPTGRLIGYARVSTPDQDPEMQIAALVAAGVPRSNIYSEHVSGAARRRPALAAALKHARKGDTILFWKLDRLARSMLHLINITQDLDRRGIGWRSLTEGLDTTTPGGRLIVYVLGAFAEFEREMTRERTRASMQRRRALGKQVGPAFKLRPSDIEKARKMLESGADQDAIAKAFRVSRNTIYRRVVRPFQQF